MTRMLAVIFVAHVFDVPTVVESHLVGVRMDLTAALICKIDRLPDPASAAARCCQTSDVLHERYAEIETELEENTLELCQGLQGCITIRPKRYAGPSPRSCERVR